jgi:hypothetical protein
MMTSVDFLADLLERHVGIVLRRDDDGVDAHGRVAVVLDRDLRLAVGPQIRERRRSCAPRRAAREVVREHDRQRHQFGVSRQA